VALTQPREPDPRVEEAFERFWDATATDVAAAADAVAATGVSFDRAMARLKSGRRYSGAVLTGVLSASYRGPDHEFFYSLDVPAGYDPRRAYPVRFQLHGGIGAREENRPIRDPGLGELRGPRDSAIYIQPTSWIDVPWWTTSQVRNLRTILEIVKRTYNVDDNRVSISGVSDGGTAGFYVAMRDATPYASFASLIGSFMLLASRTLNLGDLYPNNLVNRPFFVVNGGRDPLYPADAVEPTIRYLRTGGVPVEYLAIPDAGHDTSWWPAVQPAFERFVAARRRNPLPDRVTWQRGDDDPFTRAHWVVVDRLGDEQGRTLPDVNEVATPLSLLFGLRITAGQISYVMPDSTAGALGIQRSDVIRQINGETVASIADLDRALERCCPVGVPLRVIVSRGGRAIELAGTYSPDRPFGPTIPMFPRRGRSGRVDVVRSGNTVEATTQGVSEYTLLLSPDRFDFARPIRVVTNSRTSFEGRVERSLATLLKWAAIDRDRTMLFGAELKVQA
jgi:hypothetical protein